MVIIAELWRSKGLELMNRFSHGHHGYKCSLLHTHIKDDDDNKVAQHGGLTPADTLTETCSLGSG